MRPPPGLGTIDARRILATIDGAIGVAVVAANGQMVSTAGAVDAAAVRAECAPYLASLSAIGGPLGLGAPRSWATGGVNMTYVQRVEGGFVAVVRPTGQGPERILEKLQRAVSEAR